MTRRFAFALVTSLAALFVSADARADEEKRLEDDLAALHRWEVLYLGIAVAGIPITAWGVTELAQEKRPAEKNRLTMTDLGGGMLVGAGLLGFVGGLVKYSVADREAKVIERRLEVLRHVSVGSNGSGAAVVFSATF